ncbi:hypothetical protein GUJ93_ZPchr0003g17260 [Zizania palustris]|uniref:Uncharacterized protein n=1 Tax=Zizania palustris TaxID=103762 RepID=A0A8J5SSX1_ZIZPA|nr:hypothetical protein GUJ93_ZPchr0003g17260 [Zizania palustris]
MASEMWYIELVVGGSKVHAGCNGKLMWRHTLCLGAHAARGLARPMHRALQGLDPLAAASMFHSEAVYCIRERNVNMAYCSILKLCTDPETLKACNEGLAEITRYVIFSSFMVESKVSMVVYILRLVRSSSFHLAFTASQLKVAFGSGDPPPFFLSSGCWAPPWQPQPLAQSWWLAWAFPLLPPACYGDKILQSNPLALDATKCCADGVPVVMGEPLTISASPLAASRRRAGT